MNSAPDATSTYLPAIQIISDDDWGSKNGPRPRISGLSSDSFGSIADHFSKDVSQRESGQGLCLLTLTGERETAASNALTAEEKQIVESFISRGLSRVGFGLVSQCLNSAIRKQS